PRRARTAIPASSLRPSFVWGAAALGAQQGEQDHLADRRLVGEQHEQPIDADPLAGRGRHPLLQRTHVVLVEPVRLLVTALQQLRLFAEPRELVDRIVQLAVRVGELAPADEELETVDERGIVSLALGQRRELDGEVDHERRLYERGLDERLEDVLPELPRGPAVSREPLAGRRTRHGGG